MLRKHSASLAAVGLALAAVLAGSLAATSPAGAATHANVHKARTAAPRPDSSVNGNCNVWTDGTTFGIGCTGLPGWRYNTEVMCNNGDVASGPTESGTSGTKSYGYCSSVGSTIDYAYPQFFGPNCSMCIRRPAPAPPGAIHQARTAALRPDSSVNGNCNVWTDDITFGAGCTGLPGWYYNSNALCLNSDTATGPGEYGTSGTKSYAYCSTYSSQVLYAWVNYYR